ncbi:unnamed protein product [Pieris macdunnoughi]|uniref:Uncharacterized protein n=1 Tax=Pieris macdunnoughi TaxID=345717 RepID=A0A821RRH5_9NEOP|nr:unnamed protein product [Pieris macdunnoughi]
MTFVNLTFCLEQRCPSEISSTLTYIVEHAVWRNWNQALIFTKDLKTDCSWMILRFMKCLVVNGVAVALNVDKKPRFNIKIGVVTLSTNLARNTSVLAQHIKQV